MLNPSKRNRNIGTARQGHGQNNQLTIPRSSDGKSFYEKIKVAERQTIVINGHSFEFLVESPRKGSIHACSVSDVTKIIRQIPPADYGNLRYIIFRQPKRKENILSPVWGRLIYSFEFEKEFHPAIILEAVNIPGKIKWKKNLSVSDQLELERLKQDGHNFTDEGSFLQTELDPQNVRNTQLYRTLLHEFGHYVHYLTMVERPATESEDDEQREKRSDAYHRLPVEEKETFAHRYAAKLKSNITLV